MEYDRKNEVWQILKETYIQSSKGKHIQCVKDIENFKGVFPHTKIIAMEA